MERGPDEQSDLQHGSTTSVPGRRSRRGRQASGDVPMTRAEPTRAIDEAVDSANGRGDVEDWSANAAERSTSLSTNGTGRVR